MRNNNKSSRLNNNNNNDFGVKYDCVSTWKDWFESTIANFLHKYGFWAILLFASIPNPLFDMAGLICGHSGIPLTIFFGATFIGKAIIKVSIQSIFVIAIFVEDNLASIVDIIEHFVPISRGALTNIIEKQKQQFRDADPVAIHSKTWLQIAWQVFLVILILFFITSIINTCVHQYLKRLKTKTKNMKTPNVFLTSP